MQKELVFIKGFAKGLKYWEMIRGIQVAYELHDGQMRKGGDPYISHPMRVVSTLINLKLYDEVLLTASLLHDVLEDCGKTRSQLLMDYGFSKEVMDVVMLVTKTKNIPTNIYYDNIQKDYRALLIKISDRSHNISTMTGAFSIEKMVEYIKETEDYVIPLCKYGVRHYPEYSDAIFEMRIHIESMMDCIKWFISNIEKSEKKSIQARKEFTQFAINYKSPLDV